MLVVPRLQRSTISVIRLPALPGWAEFGCRPSGPGSDLRSILEFPHLTRWHSLTQDYVLGYSQPPLRDSIWTRHLLLGERQVCEASYSDLVEVVDGAGLGVLSVLVAGALSDVPPLSAGAELPSELLPPSCDLPDAAGLAA